MKIISSNSFEAQAIKLYTNYFRDKIYDDEFANKLNLIIVKYKYYNNDYCWRYISRTNIINVLGSMLQDKNIKIKLDVA